MTAPTITPDTSDPARCISTHWSLPAQCTLSSSHRENWHETRHPESGLRMRYRYGPGVCATEEWRDNEWRDLGIPGPDNRGREQLLAEIGRLNGELAKYVGWEPTVREEYEHACGQIAACHEVLAKLREEALNGHGLNRDGARIAVRLLAEALGEEGGE